jgi:hypothetical protein
MANRSPSSSPTSANDDGDERGASWCETLRSAAHATGRAVRMWPAARRRPSAQCPPAAPINSYRRVHPNLPGEHLDEVPRTAISCYTGHQPWHASRTRPTCRSAARMWTPDWPVGKDTRDIIQACTFRRGPREHPMQVEVSAVGHADNTSNVGVCANARSASSSSPTSPSTSVLRDPMRSTGYRSGPSPAAADPQRPPR